MRMSRKNLFIFLLVSLFATILVTFELPYYIYKPGHTALLEEVVAVDGGYESEGKMQLVTISGAQATPLEYLWAKIVKFHDIVPIVEARPDGISDEEYMYNQLHLMESSQQASTVVAYRAADKDISVEFKGIHVVSVIDGMPAKGVLEVGDIITEIDSKQIKETNQLMKYIETKKPGDTIQVTLIRNNETLSEEIELKTFSDNEDKVGIGIQLATQRDVHVKPEVSFQSGNIGGPSAGLMFSLEIYNQLVEGDISKGYNLVGTGEVDYDGNVLRIGGVDKKVIAADRKNCDIFFAPNEEGKEDSNYVVAKQTADHIKTDMKIVPVDHFDDVLNYLEELEAKNN